MASTGRPRKVVVPPAEARVLTKRGWSLKQLAARYGCSAQTVLNRMREAGIPRHAPHSCPGSRNPAWKGGQYLDDDGYVLVYMPGHPYSTKAGRVRKHRLVMEIHLGRYLHPREVVHHKDGNRQNNSIGNLELFASNGDHLANTLAGKCPKWTKQGKEAILRAVHLPRKKRPASSHTE